jgi:hypothetical protein
LHPDGSGDSSLNTLPRTRRGLPRLPAIPAKIHRTAGILQAALSVRLETC